VLALARLRPLHVSLLVLLLERVGPPSTTCALRVEVNDGLLSRVPVDRETSVPDEVNKGSRDRGCTTPRPLRARASSSPPPPYER